MLKSFRSFTIRALALVLTAQLAVQPVAAQSRNIALIRDAEIESLMRAYTSPIFKVAGIKEGAAKIYLINEPSINAFVAGGQRIFINTGLLVQAKTPNEVIGVLAHETGHISGGHLARMGQQMDKASTTAILGMLLGAAAMVGGAASGQGEAAQMGQGIMMGSQGLAQRNLLSYARAQEAAADQAAVKYLDQSGQSGEGMLTLFQTLANQSLGSLQNVNPYVMSHPMPLDRIRNLEQIVKKSPNYGKADSPELVMRHKLMQAKLTGFLDSPQQVYQRYPRSDMSLPARYARAIAAFRVGDLKSAIPDIEALIKAQPNNPYFWELKGQALIEGGRPADAVAPLQQSVKLAPQAGLIQIMLAQAQLGTEDNANAAAALKTLQQAARTESDNVSLWRFQAVAYGKLGDIPNAELSTAEAAIRSGDRELAAQKAKSAMAKFAKGTPEWVRANDILNFTSKKKKG
jgi:predicted Zn-dependent protease